MAPLEREQYDLVRQSLDKLGYTFPLPTDSVSLVGQLTADIVAQQKKIAQVERIIADLQQEKLFNNISVEPFKRDNAHLLTDNVELQRKIDDLQSHHEEQTKALRKEIKILEEKLDDLQFINGQAAKNIQQLEKEIVLRDCKLLDATKGKPTCQTVGSRLCPPGPVLELSGPIETTCTETAVPDYRNNAQALDIIKIMENRAANSTKNLQVLKQDNCKLSECVVNLKKQMKDKDSEILRLRKTLEGGRAAPSGANNVCCECQQKETMMDDLERQVKAAVDKQHEAMSRAVQLAERNQHLERELKDLVNMATSLEETFKRDSRVNELESTQARLEAIQRENKELEIKLKQTEEQLEKELKLIEKLRNDKRLLERDLNQANNEKKTLNDKINAMVVETAHLREEVDSLKAANQTLHRRWSEKDPKVCNDPACAPSSCPCKCPSPIRRRDPPWKSKRLKDLSEPKFCGCAPSLLLLDKLQKERDYYHQQFHAAVNKPPCTCICTTGQDFPPMKQSQEDAVRLLMDRVERDRDAALAELRTVVTERDMLRDRLRTFPEFPDANRSVDVGADRQCEELRQQLRTCQAELAHVNGLYAQLKNLHDQTDRSCMSAQTRVTYLEAEVRRLQDRLGESERAMQDMEKNSSFVNSEKMSLRHSLTMVEKEKDELVMTLDEKTERLSRMETEIKKRESQIAEANRQMSEAQQKFEQTLSEKVSRDHAFRTLKQTLERVREELKEAKATIEEFRKEKIRLSEELSAALRDGNAAHKEVEISRQEVNNLKKQLQQYVTEVERAEELIARKEKEQAEIWENFNRLSLEASSMENNNHTLETEVAVTKMTVSDLMSQVQDLKAQLTDRDSLVEQLEKQIASLTAHIAELEANLSMKAEQCQRLERDLEAVNELCKCLDGQKEELKAQTSSIDNEKIKLSREVRRLSQENNGLSDALDRERNEAKILKDTLCRCRQETLKHQSSNKDLTALVHELKKKVDDLTNKLEEESLNVRRYEEQCSELSQEVNQLRRDMTNLRFESARSSRETSRSRIE